MSTDYDIPSGAVEVRLFSEESPEDFFSTIRIGLEDAGFMMVNVSNVRLNLLTGRMDVGRGVELEMRVHDVVNEVGTPHCIAILFGRTDREDAEWTGSGDDESHAFAQMVEIAAQIPHVKMEFRVR